LKLLIEETSADCVCWTRRYEPAVLQRDAAIKKALKEQSLVAESFNGSLLHEPWEIETGASRPYQVFTPFWNACLKLPEATDPRPSPRGIPAPARWPKSLRLDELDLEPSIDWTAGIRESWSPGERGAHARLEAFLSQNINEYETQRDRPDCAGTSGLSPHLHFGEISPRRIWHAVAQHVATQGKSSHDGCTRFLTEIGWREFAHHLLYHFPQTPIRPLREQFVDFPWRRDSKSLRAWQSGLTGYPLVDAGMRQLWRTGWMHNRVRMVVASFLVKHLLLPWQDGAKWFWDTLVDADLANNTLGWQWSAGCGADAAPYFRIFNPVAQGQKFDPNGDYIRRWIPELAQLSAKFVHQPWTAPPEVLLAARVILGRTYPRPIVDHREARQRALEAFASLSK
jgi:deoxyribodipyrimidine photo-lyase